MSEATYYFNSWGNSGGWGTPANAVDGDTGTQSDNYTPETTIMNGNTASGSGTISKVEVRVYGFYLNTGDLNIQPYFGGSSDGDIHYVDIPANNPDWSSYIDITSDTNAPGSWSWTDITNLDLKLITSAPMPPFDRVSIFKVEIRVTYSASTPTVYGNASIASGNSSKAILKGSGGNFIIKN